MRGLMMRVSQLRRQPERGSVQLFLILTVVTLVVVVGLVVDGGGKVQLATDAQHVASSAARAATNAISAETVAGHALSIDALLATQVAEDYIENADMTGTVSVDGATITVTTEAVYATRFVSLIGISTLTVSGTATASLIDGPTG
ncbi:hypothetical protein F8O01_02955 [Pseudoclavibacter chungangensis]|uniref:Putative Flp pilus-assembly TadG-like N-terminal domain-containing protein n=1 Tax=Pseudoclavibacter chungangensis TaxID=587635 RepID=A0A7J5C2M5_9MICO|nr:pilus assembly protein TadG-related protein [Pseudoclavibacter chungangensis]KAB1660303.1 hypothetical protein F8O01_02955 [Pseudoclavibacter chungangensis]NYJ65654.1 uncharacterized protein YdeI (BOF family) [Pseudoclavibacter chungangensis]